MENTKSDEWTEEKCIQLIREFRARPVLWDPKDAFFFKKTLKPVAWREIGTIINCDPDACKHKMVVLMSSFRREKAKIMHGLADRNADGSGNSYKSTWFAFKEMAFLMDKDNERKRQLLGEENVEDDDEPSIKKVVMQHYIEPPIKKDARHCKAPLVVKHLTKKVMEAAREEASTTPPPQSNSPFLCQTPLSSAGTTPALRQTLSDRDEEIKSFATFIGNKMKRYSDETKNAVQQAICEIIFKADQQVFESSNYEKYTLIDASDPLDKHFETPEVKTQILYSDSE
ncbi:uncharacterized protein LOC115440144 [Manduca sexta]|uniref:MADF domain-containing protein n=1 Tax=Manduca sexta TaxID=7130 RepID=A0A921YTH4_MANSE|nr:uncharacterized protein LOC115440144 [Manduca sexta]KAG6444990.1 hypothetical protein O3G_MSEX003708 [Manduca sexta]